MRSWLAIALLVMLPLQWSSAAVAAYCGHDADTAPQVQHLGHHEHQHAQADVASSGADAVTTSALDTVTPAADTAAPSDAPALHFDCGHCHASPAAVVVNAVAWPLDAPLAHVDSAPLARWHSLAATRPERPQWARLA